MRPLTIRLLSVRRSLPLFLAIVVCLAIWQVWLTWRMMEQDRNLAAQHSRERASSVRPTGHADFTADGQWFLYHDAGSNGKPILSRVASAGGQPERLGDLPTSAPSGTMRISPDGSKVMVAAGEYGTAYEMWSLENFVPAAPKPGSAH